MVHKYLNNHWRVGVNHADFELRMPWLLPGLLSYYPCNSQYLKLQSYKLQVAAARDVYIIEEAGVKPEISRLELP